MNLAAVIVMIGAITSGDERGLYVGVALGAVNVFAYLAMIASHFQVLKMDFQEQVKNYYKQLLVIDREALREYLNICQFERQ